MTVKFYKNLSNNYLELLDDKEDFNVIINAGEAPDSKTFQAHSAILRYRSMYFRSVLANIEKDSNNIKTINLEHVSVQQFEIILKYIYGGIVALENLESSFIFELMLVAYEFLLEELAKHLESYLIKAKPNWLYLYFAHIYKLSFQNENLHDLQRWCNSIAAKCPNLIFDSDDFKTLQEPALISLIGRDDLQMDEVKLWSYVIKWGIAQNSDIPIDPKDWSNDNILSMKNSLQNCLPLIRYFQMSGDDIVNSVQPYQQILDKDLWEDIIKYFMAPSQQITSLILPPREITITTLATRSNDSFSSVINESHAAEIASWIDKKSVTYSVKENPYVFKLLLRGSKDGFFPSVFWDLCDKQANTVVVIKIKGTDEILGGYNPLEWDRSSSLYNSCNDSFLFSLKNGSIKRSIVSRIKAPEKAIYCCPNNGPCFGGGHDLTILNSISKNKCYCRHLSYEKPIRNKHVDHNGRSSFLMEDYEVLQIHEKSNSG